RVHLLDGRDEEQVHALGGGDPRVALEVARVGVEVLALTELQRVDEHRHDDEVVVLPGGPHERRVALVQVAHRGDEPDRATRGPVLGQPVAQLADRGHGQRSVHRASPSSWSWWSWWSWSRPSPSSRRPARARWCRRAASRRAASTMPRLARRSSAGRARRWRRLVDSPPRAAAAGEGRGGARAATLARARD